MSRFLALLVVVAFAWPAAALRAGEPSGDPAHLDFFESKVRPLLDNHCLGCHGPEKQKAGLRLDSRGAALKGGDSGPVMKPGDPERSRIIEVIRYDSDVRMPPRRKLDQTEIGVLTDWIKAGAPWPEPRETVRPPAPASSFVISAEDRGFWSFRPVSDPAPPPLGDLAWPRSPIDRFVLARLKSAKLQPVAAADRPTLIRRATFDLTGLPPTPREIDAFVADESPEAFDRVVDRLLGSPRYGERWARHWLDLARYGEDQAHTFQARLYPYGYRYRDWVVKALNDDMPYDRFLVEQIAGDLIEGPGRDDRLAATGLFALGPVYYDKAVFDQLDDRVDTLTRGVLGLTVACARCHDHKFDPIGQRDYYALAGVFQSTDYQEYPHALAAVVARYDQAQAAIKAKTQEIAAFLRAESKLWSERAASTQTARYMIAAWTLANRRKVHAGLSTADFARGEGLEPVLLDRWSQYVFTKEAANRPYLARWRRVLERLDSAGDLSLDESSWMEVADAAFGFQTYVQASLRLRDAAKEHDVAAAAVAADGEKAPEPRLKPDGPEAGLFRDLLAADGLFGLPKDRLEGNLPAATKAALKDSRAELERVKKEAPPKYPVVHALADGRSPANMRVHIRGNPATLGEEAPRRFLGILSEQDAPAFTQGSGRLELARAIAGADNPLTARVLVNRVWAQHFGRGLVATPSNFGRLGERPSHPELLDHLAHRFMSSGWSIKRLHRAIMLSATYQLSSALDPLGQETDPANTLLWHASRRRLDVEAWRDAMLAVAGELDDRVGGPSAELKSAEMRRRTLYGTVSRHNLDGLLRLFDFPDPNLTSDRRVVTTVPLQQLFVLNSPFMQARARALAARLTDDPAQADADRIRRVVPALFGRAANDEDIALGIEFLRVREEQASKDQKAVPTRWEQYAQALLGTNEFTFID